VTFKAVSNPEQVKVFEQNYQGNLIDTDSILEKYIDREIALWIKLGSASIKVIGILLGYNDEFILKTNNGISVYNTIESIVFPGLPEGFYTKPTLNWKVFSE
jgi:hypothetical protein